MHCRRGRDEGICIARARRRDVFEEFDYNVVKERCDVCVDESFPRGIVCVIN